MISRTLALVATCALAAVAAADDGGEPTKGPFGVENAGDLHDQCEAFLEVLAGRDVRTPDQAIRIASCLAYVRGFREGHQLAAVQDALREPGVTPASARYDRFGFYCRAEKVSDGDVAKLLVKFLRARPAKRSLPPGVALGLALQEAFPCERGEAP